MNINELIEKAKKDCIENKPHNILGFLMARNLFINDCLDKTENKAEFDFFIGSLEANQDEIYKYIV